MTEHLSWTVEDGIGRITLDRPERMNAFTFAMIDAAAMDKTRASPRTMVSAGHGGPAGARLPSISR